MGLTDVELLWSCHLCGLDTPTPAEHLRVHGMTIEEVMERAEKVEAARRAMERLMLMQQEVGLRSACPLCGHQLGEPL